MILQSIPKQKASYAKSLAAFEAVYRCIFIQQRLRLYLPSARHCPKCLVLSHLIFNYLLKAEAIFPTLWRWKLQHREDISYCHLRLSRSMTDSIISPFIGLTYTNGILIISIPWHRNFAISLFFSFLSFPLSGMSLHKLFLQQMSYTCQYISILSSNALMQAHFFPGSLNYHNIL